MKLTRKKLMEMAGLINEENGPMIHAVSLDNMAGTTSKCNRTPSGMTLFGMT